VSQIEVSRKKKDQLFSTRLKVLAHILNALYMLYLIIYVLIYLFKELGLCCFPLFICVLIACESYVSFFRYCRSIKEGEKKSRRKLFKEMTNITEKRKEKKK